MARDFDVVLYGATGFTGRITARRLAESDSGVRWAIAGRNRRKLETVRDGLPNPPEILVADSAEPQTIREMCARTKVVATTVGPFRRYGTPVVEAAVAEGTHYCDITGETVWVRDLIDRLHDEARDRGVRIIPFCGFDSLPSDIGAFVVARAIREELGQDTLSVTSMVKMKGGASGGTIATMLDSAQSPAAAQMRDPLLLNPDTHRSDAARQASRDDFKIRYDEDFGAYRAAFLMATVNTRVVRRSHALLDAGGEGYGAHFVYQEYADCRSRRSAWTTQLGLGSLALLLQSRLGRSLIKRFTPDPGDGLSQTEMDTGFMRCRFVGVAADGQKRFGRIQYGNDPGYGTTSLMLAQSAICLALDEDKLPQRAGLLTPATGMGQAIVDRLRSVGMIIEVAPTQA